MYHYAVFRLRLFLSRSYCQSNLFPPLSLEVIFLLWLLFLEKWKILRYNFDTIRHIHCKCTPWWVLTDSVTWLACGRMPWNLDDFLTFVPGTLPHVYSRVPCTLEGVCGCVHVCVHAFGCLWRLRSTLGISSPLDLHLFFEAGSLTGSHWLGKIAWLARLRDLSAALLHGVHCCAWLSWASAGDRTWDFMVEFQCFTD